MPVSRHPGLVSRRVEVALANDDRRVVLQFAIPNEDPQLSVDQVYDLLSGATTVPRHDFAEPIGAEFRAIVRFALEKTVGHQHQKVSSTNDDFSGAALPPVLPETDWEAF